MISFTALLALADDYILKIENEKVSLSEFKNILLKNNDKDYFTKEYLNEYMQLFVNFKLKVKEAESLGMDTIPSFIKELNGYKKQLAKPYLKNKEFEKSLIIEAYERTKYDVNASHILVSFGEQSDEEINTARKKIMKIKEEIINNKISFDDAALKYSDDKSSKINKGNLGYFTSFMMVYPFESAVYNCKIDQICGPVKTKYGYHLVKLNDKRKAIGEVQVAHIMFKTQKGNEVKNINAKKRIFEIYEKLQNEEDFEDLAERFSEDKSSAVKGGTLPKFGVGKMVKEFERISFNLSNAGDISKPFETDFGWHIVKLIERNQIKSYDELESEIKKKIQRDSRANLNKEKLIEKLNKEYKVRKFEKRIKQIKKYGNEDVYKAEWDGKNAKGLIFTLFMIDETKINQQDFINYIVDNQKKGSTIDELYNEYVDFKLIEHEEKNLSKKYPEYKALIDEYRDGILLFDLTNKVVWGKAVEDTVGLSNYFQKNISNYFWKERMNASIYKCSDIEVARKVKKLIYKKRRNKINNEDILQKININNPLNLSIEEGKFERGSNQLIDKLIWSKGFSKDIVSEEGSITIIDKIDILPPQPKLIDEIKGKVISDYQNELDKQWILILRDKYNFEINYNVLYSLIDK